MRLVELWIWRSRVCQTDSGWFGMAVEQSSNSLWEDGLADFRWVWSGTGHAPHGKHEARPRSQRIRAADSTAPIQNQGRPVQPERPPIE